MQSIWPGSGSAVSTGSSSTPFALYDADSEFQMDQIKDILFPALEKKEPDSSKRISPTSTRQGKAFYKQK